MTDREKLVELLTDNLPRIGGFPKCDNPLQYTSDEIVERIADHLLANGVIVLPCKVGDEVWGIRSYHGVKHPQQGRVDEMYFTSDMRLNIRVKHICIGNWGEKIFATREEAEEALKEGEAKNWRTCVIDRKPFIEDEIYPLTITADRYSGTYSGGNYVAWHLDADEVPDDIYSDDCGCYRFWSHNEIVCGIGITVSEALADLYLKLKEDKEGE